MSTVVFVDSDTITKFGDSNKNICLVSEVLDVSLALLAIKNKVQAVMVRDGTRYSHGGILLSGSNITIFRIHKGDSLPEIGTTGVVDEQMKLRDSPTRDRSRFQEYRTSTGVRTVRNPHRKYDPLAAPLLISGLKDGICELGYNVFAASVIPAGGMEFVSEKPFASDLQSQCENSNSRVPYLLKAASWLDIAFETIRNDVINSTDAYKALLHECLVRTTLIHWDYATTLSHIVKESYISLTQLTKLAMFFTKNSVLGWRRYEPGYWDQSKEFRARPMRTWPSTSCSKDISNAVRYTAPNSVDAAEGIFQYAQIVAVKEWNLFLVQTILSRITENGSISELDRKREGGL